MTVGSKNSNNTELGVPFPSGMDYCGLEYLNKVGRTTLFSFLFIWFSNTNLNNRFLEKVANSLLADFNEFQEKDSGWAFNKTVNLMVRLNKLNPLRAGSFV